MSKNNQITSKLESTKNNTAQVKVVISKTLVAKNKQDSLKHLAADVSIKGFRQGKAPLNLVQAKLDPQKVTEHTLEHLLPQALKYILTKHSLKVMGNPALKSINTPADKDWELSIDLPLMPPFKLGEYKKVIKKALPGSKIWTPKQGDPKSPPQDNRDEKLQKMLSALLASIKFDVPQMMIDSEVNQSLTRLLGQTEKLGISIEEYLKSLGKTSEQLRGEYQKAAHDNLRLELILDQISLDLKIKVDATEIDAMIKNSGDEKIQKSLNTPSQRQHISGILRKRKTIDSLLKL